MKVDMYGAKALLAYIIFVLKIFLKNQVMIFLYGINLSLSWLFIFI